MSMGMHRGARRGKVYPVWERRVKVAELYLEGTPQPAIAKKLGVSQPTVGRDLIAIREEWLKSSIRDFDSLKVQEIAKIDKLEEAAWAAWHRSTLEHRIVQNKTESMRRSMPGAAGKKGAHRLVPTKVTENITVKNCPGDPKFMETIAWCIETRLKVIGAFKDVTNVNNLVIDWGKMVMHDDNVRNPVLEVDVIESKIQQAGIPYRGQVDPRNEVLSQESMVLPGEIIPDGLIEAEAETEAEYGGSNENKDKRDNTSALNPVIFPLEKSPGTLGESVITEEAYKENTIGRFVEEESNDEKVETEDEDSEADDESVYELIKMLQGKRNN